MKFKFLHSLLFTSLLLGIYFTTTSNSGGIMGKSTAGCGGSGCHGTSASSSTTVSILGLPTDGKYKPDSTYNITVGGVNMSKAKAGFDLSCSAGTFLNNGASNVMVMGTEVHHTLPATTISGVGGWTLKWKAPSTLGNVSINLAYNAVDGTGSENNDAWNLYSISLVGAYPASISTVESNKIKVYPNPVVNEIFVETQTNNPKIEIYNAQGQVLNLPKQVKGNIVKLDASQVAKGNYVILVTQEGKIAQKHITKN